MLTFFGIIFAFPLGVLLALGKRSELPVIKYFCIAFVEFWRGIPLITVLFAAAIMFPLLLPANTNVDKLLRVAIGMGIFESAYVAEVIRGGLQSLPKGQYEAAKSLGMSYWKMNFLIILPQAIKTVLPGLTNTFIALFKDTPLIILVGLLELLGMVNLAKSNSYWLGMAIEGYIFVGIIFWFFSYLLSRYTQSLEKKFSTERH
jgi:general L-amino acid transport system permease protein